MGAFETITRKFFWWLIMPDMIMMLLIAVGIVFLLFKNTKWAKRFILSACSLVLLFGIVPIGFWMLEHLENRFPPITEIPADTKGVIVLGGSFDRMTTMGRKQTSYNLAGGRLIEFIKFTRQHPDLLRVFTGGGALVSFHDGPGRTEAEIAKQELEAIGFDTTGMIFEDKSANTIENAINTKELIQPNPEDKWVLMTSAFHMPRSVGLFRKAGWSVIPYPVDYHTPGRYEPYFFIGLKNNLTAWQYAIREWASMIQNYLFGRSDELFPSEE